MVRRTRPGISRFRVRCVASPRMTVVTGWALRTHRLDIVAVGVGQESRVVSRAVIGARSGAAIVAAAGLEAFGVKFSDRGMVGRAERDVRAGAPNSLLPVHPPPRLPLPPKTPPPTPPP